MISDLKDLDKLFKLCRKQGITDIKVAGIEIKFGDLPQGSVGSISNSTEEEVVINPYDGFPQEILSPEQLTHYAMGGTVDDDPFLKKAQ